MIEDLEIVSSVTLIDLMLRLQTVILSGGDCVQIRLGQKVRSNSPEYNLLLR